MSVCGTERIDRLREQQIQRIVEAEAVAAEWEGPPDLDAVLDFYNGLIDIVSGKVRQARGAVELNRALSQVIAGMWAALDDGRLRAEFELRYPGEAPHIVLPANPYAKFPTGLDAAAKPGLHLGVSPAAAARGGHVWCGRRVRGPRGPLLGQRV